MSTHLHFCLTLLYATLAVPIHVRFEPKYRDVAIAAIVGGLQTRSGVGKYHMTGTVSLDLHVICIWDWLCLAFGSEITLKDYGHPISNTCEGQVRVRVTGSSLAA
jgi:hypothetical protein